MATIDFSKVKKQFYRFLQSKISQKTAEQYYKYLEKYLTEPIDHPAQLGELLDEIKEESRGGKLRWVSSAIANLLDFYEKRLGFPTEMIYPYRKALQWEKSNPDEGHITTDQLVEAYEIVSERGKEARITFCLIMFSGVRILHAVRILQSYDIQNLVIVNDKVARYPIHFVSAGKKRGYWAYMPLSFAETLEQLNIDYGIRDAINHGMVTGKKIRKWHMNFLIENGIPESVADYIQGRASVTVGSSHYLNKTKQADEWYSKIVDKFPIKEVDTKSILGGSHD